MNGRGVMSRPFLYPVDQSIEFMFHLSNQQMLLNIFDIQLLKLNQLECLPLTLWYQNSQEMDTNIPQITFDQLPASVAELHRKMDVIMAAIGSPLPESDPDRLMTMEQLIEYLPDHPARATVFGWTCARTIPFQKHGRRLYFRVGDIDEWLNHGRQIRKP